MVAGRKRQLQECRICDLSGRTPPEEATLKQILLAAPSGGRDRWHGPDYTLILEQPLQHTDRCVKRRACTLRRFAIPTAVLKLLAYETPDKTLLRASEVSANRERTPVDTRLLFALEERVAAGLRQTQLPAVVLVVPPQPGLETRHRGLDCGFGTVDAGRAQQQKRNESRRPDR